MSIDNHFYPQRLRTSKIERGDNRDQFYNDRSRIVFCSSFRRMMKKAQVFSLETNTSVRNRLTHSLEVADIGRTLARSVGRQLEQLKLATSNDTECLIAIVENACLLHDIGNPPFGHFGEEAVKNWFRGPAKQLTPRGPVNSTLSWDPDALLHGLQHFDGNPQGFRIATRLHSEVDDFGLNLTASTLLASIKYPNHRALPATPKFSKKLGIFDSEIDVYEQACSMCNFPQGRRYFLAYLMELSDDICYCLSDIADSFEKRIITARDYYAEMRAICEEMNVDGTLLLPPELASFPHDVSIQVSRTIISEAATEFSRNIDTYLTGEAPELAKSLPSGGLLDCLKAFSRKWIYSNREAQRIEIAGHQIVTGLLDHYAMLLRISRKDFQSLVHSRQLSAAKLTPLKGLDAEWRVFSQLAPRMLKVYEAKLQNSLDDQQELLARSQLIVDYIAGMTDDSARDEYQNFMGISL